MIKLYIHNNTRFMFFFKNLSITLSWTIIIDIELSQLFEKK